MNKLEALRCIEVTSQTQANNGTVCYHDPMTGADYLSYENGYIRRAYKTTRYRSMGMGSGGRTIYQLNPTRTVTSPSPWSGEPWKHVERVMLPTHEERMEKLAHAVVNYRNYKNK